MLSTWLPPLLPPLYNIHVGKYSMDNNDVLYIPLVCFFFINIFLKIFSTKTFPFFSLIKLLKHLYSKYVNLGVMGEC